MASNCPAMTEGSRHESATDAFAVRAQERFGDSIPRLEVVGTAACHAARDGSDVDGVPVLEGEDDEDEDENENQRRTLAVDLGLESGVVLSSDTPTAGRFESRIDHPFVRTVFDEGLTYA